MKAKRLSVRTEPAILVALVLRDQAADFDHLSELSALADTAGAAVVGELIQTRAKIDPQYYIGTGKVRQLAAMVESSHAQVVIFDNDLTPSQIRNLERAVACKVIDRSELILDIFATHARTNQARLQVELAQFQYTYPRLTKMWTHLERIADAAGGNAGAVGGIGTRGPGERQLETDRRLVQKGIHRLKRQLAKIDKRKLREVSNRDDQFTVCLIGYTNAGKSTLMNALTGAGVHVEDRLFATLDTRTRRWRLGGGLHVLLSDTIGFIRKLPHHLVASFRATLEEAIHADLLLHVVDASNIQAVRQIETVNTVLADLGCSEKDIVTVFNKTDLLRDSAPLRILAKHVPTGLAVSAVNHNGLAELTEQIRWYFLKPPLHLTLDVDSHAGKLLAFLEKHTRIHRTEYLDNTTRVQLTLSANRVGAMRKFIGQYKIVGAYNTEAAAVLGPDTVEPRYTCR